LIHLDDWVILVKAVDQITDSQFAHDLVITNIANRFVNNLSAYNNVLGMFSYQLRGNLTFDIILSRQEDV
jgi:hypothetical protein